MNAREAIEHQVNTVYKSCVPAYLSVKEPGLADIDVNVSELKGAFIFTNDMQTHDKDFYFDLERTEPLVMMYFQLKGSAHFVDNKPFIVPPMHHSVNHVPLFRSRCLAEKNTSSKNLCIKINPRVLLREWPEELSNDKWLRAIEAGQPMVTLHKSKPMTHTIQQNVNQLLDCPYTGQLGTYFKESIIRLLLIQQLAEFAFENHHGDKQVANELNLPTKLTRSDVAALQDLRQYLEVNFLEDVSLDKLARRAGLNRFKLKHGFRTLFKTSVMRFIDEKKMNYAKQILLSQDDNTGRFDLSDLLGYNHYSNFSAAFKKHFGHSPSTYKKHFSYKIELQHRDDITQTDSLVRRDKLIHKESLTQRDNLIHRENQAQRENLIHREILTQRENLIQSIALPHKPSIKEKIRRRVLSCLIKKLANRRNCSQEKISSGVKITLIKKYLSHII